MYVYHYQCWPCSCTLDSISAKHQLWNKTNRLVNYDSTKAHIELKRKLTQISSLNTLDNILDDRKHRLLDIRSNYHTMSLWYFLVGPSGVNLQHIEDDRPSEERQYMSWLNEVGRDICNNWGQSEVRNYSEEVGNSWCQWKPHCWKPGGKMIAVGSRIQKWLIILIMRRLVL